MIKDVLRGYIFLKKLILIKTLLAILPLALGVGLAAIFISLGEFTMALIAFGVGVFLGGVSISIAVAYFIHRMVKTYRQESSRSLHHQRFK